MKKFLSVLLIITIIVLITSIESGCRKISKYTSQEDAAEGKIAFASNRDGNSEIYIMNTDGSELTNLTNNPASDRYPSFSPDGKKIAFVSNRDKNSEIYIMNADGSEQTRLTYDEDEYGTDINYKIYFSLDGTKIAFLSGLYDIYKMNIDGSGKESFLYLTTNDCSYSISPDWSKIAISECGGIEEYNSDIVKFNVNDEYRENEVNITNNPANDWAPNFSPDGKKIAFSSDRDGNSEIYIMNVGGSKQTRLTNYLGQDSLPSFSSDMSKIVFVSNDDICIMNIDGSDKVNLTKHPATDSSPCFSPDVTSKKVKATIGLDTDVIELFEACKQGNYEAVKRLIEQDMDINAKEDFIGNTALMYAAGNGYTEIAETLIDNGADVDAVDYSEWDTALMYAVVNGHTEAAKMLLDKGADINAISYRGRTALMYASREGHTEVVKLLLDKEAEVDLLDIGGNSSLLYASKKGHTEIVDLMLNNGAEVDLQNVYGGNALMAASSKGPRDWTYLYACGETPEGSQRVV